MPHACTSLRCDVQGGLDPQRKKDCKLDWVGLLLPRHATAQPDCAGDTVETAKRVLHYGEKWSRAGRVCESKRSGLHCSSEDGYHYKPSEDGWKRRL